MVHTYHPSLCRGCEFEDYCASLEEDVQRAKDDYAHTLAQAQNLLKKTGPWRLPPPPRYFSIMK